MGSAAGALGAQFGGSDLEVDATDELGPVGEIQPPDVEAMQMIRVEGAAVPSDEIFMFCRKMSDDDSLEYLYWRQAGSGRAAPELGAAIVSPEARHYALLLMIHPEVGRYQSWRLLKDIWAHANRRRQDALPLSPWGGLQLTSLEPAANRVPPSLAKEFKGTPEWHSSMGGFPRVLDKPELLQKFSQDECWNRAQLLNAAWDWARWPADTPSCMLYYNGGVPKRTVSTGALRLRESHARTRK